MRPDFLWSLMARVFPEQYFVVPQLVSLDGQPTIKDQQDNRKRQQHAAAKDIGQHYSGPEKADIGAMFGHDIRQWEQTVSAERRNNHQPDSDCGNSSAMSQPKHTDGEHKQKTGGQKESGIQRRFDDDGLWID